MCFTTHFHTNEFACRYALALMFSVRDSLWNQPYNGLHIPETQGDLVLSSLHNRPKLLTGGISRRASIVSMQVLDYKQK